MKFALFGLPRSGTTWAANWLSDGAALCLHDPIAQHAPADLLDLDMGRPWGVACTGLWAFEDVAREVAGRCPVVVLERDPRESEKLAAGIGLDLPASVHAWIHARFAGVPGVRVPHSALWDEQGARRIWSILRPGEPFDVLRWRMLRDIRVEPILERVEVCAATVAALRGVFNQGEHHGEETAATT